MNPDIPMLDSTSCPLNGVCMIEAAAGTGKTYNIQNLVLRLILEQDIPISGILVVTFTEAATAELRTRIRDMLRNALNYAAGSAIPEKERPRIKAIMEHAAQNTPGETLVRRLRNAFIDFDSSTISTMLMTMPADARVFPLPPHVSACFFPMIEQASPATGRIKARINPMIAKILVVFFCGERSPI